MICKVCGTENADDCTFCANCGAALETEVPAAEAPEVVSVEQDTFDEQAPVEEQKDGGKLFGILSISIGGGAALLSLLTAFSCWCSCLACFGWILWILAIVLGIAAIVLGILGMIFSKKSGHQNKLALFGIILGAVAFVLPVISFWLNWVFSCVMSLILSIFGGGTAGVGSVLDEFGSYNSYGDYYGGYYY